MILQEVKETYSQDMDSCAPGDMWNYIEILTQDGGAGPYIILQTERWALDLEEIDAFAQKLKDMIARVQKEQEQEKEEKGV